MELASGEKNISSELLKAQTHAWNYMHGFVSSMCLKCAVELGISDIIYKHGKPMLLSELVSSLGINPSKSPFLYRLMRLLVHTGLFVSQKVSESEEECCYSLAEPSHFLLNIKNNPMTASKLLIIALDPVMVKTWQCLSQWFLTDKEVPNAFSVAHGMTFWEYATQEHEFSELFYEGMLGDSFVVSKILVGDHKELFEGLTSLVDVGGGSGIVSNAIAEAFPDMDCTVFDRPEAISAFKGTTRNFKFLGGNMFEAIPAADAIIMKWLLCDWSDEECVKILKNCKAAVKTKVIIIEKVVGYQNLDHKSVETQLFFDLVLMVFVEGRQRNEEEWTKLFKEAGFTNYKIHPIMGTRAVMRSTLNNRSIKLSVGVFYFCHV